MRTAVGPRSGNPQTIWVGDPYGVVYDPLNRYLYVPDFATAHVSVLNTTTYALVTSIRVGNGSSQAFFDRLNNRVYVENLNSGNVSVIDASTNHVSGSINVGGGGFMALDTTSGDVYLPGYPNIVYTINGTSNTVVATIPVGAQPTSATFDSSNGRIYVTNYGSNNVSVIDATRNRVVASIAVGSLPVAASISPRTGLLYVANLGSGNVTAFNVGSNHTIGSARVGSSPVALTFGAGDQYLYVVNSGSDSVTVVNGSTAAVVGSAATGSTPVDIAYDNTTGYLYVANSAGGSLTALALITSVASNPSTASIQTGDTASFAAVPDCAGWSCPTDPAYKWTETNSVLGVLNSSSGQAVKFTAGSTPGFETLFINATLDGVTRESRGIQVTITPRLVGVSVTPASATIAAGSSMVFSAAPACTGGTCPTGASYVWSLNNSLGSLNASAGPSVTFASGTLPGRAGLSVTASLNGGRVSSPQVSVLIQSSVVGKLSRVSLSPLVPSVSTGGTEVFTATASCSGGTCSPPVSWTWVLSNALGSLNRTTGPSVTFKAGLSSGVVTISVNATEGGQSLGNSTQLTIQASSVSTSPGGGSTPSPSGSLEWYLLVASAVVVAAALAVLWNRRRKTPQSPRS